MPIHDAIRQRLQPVAASVTSNRILLYALFSTCAMVGAIINACISQSNFYAVMIHLSRSGRSVLILSNFGFLATLAFGRILQKIFFGPLQPREVERLYDHTWMFVTESLLAFTIFRDEFDIPFVLMFGLLLFVKCFHWLMADRVESMDQVTYPGPPTLFHIRMNALFVALLTVDFIMFSIAVESTLDKGVGGMVLFATEYAILVASSLNALAKYSLSNLDYRRAATRGGENAPPWEHKSMYIFYIELVTDFLKLAIYLAFFTIILTFYGLPLNIIRDVYLTARSFITRLRALIRYNNATRDMDRRYPNATEEELTAMSDRTCIICREELASTGAPAAQDGQADGTPAVPNPPPPTTTPAQQDGPNMTPKKLPCGHIFHFQCLRSWLERQQSCPTCRRTVLETDTPNRDGNQQQRQQRPQPPQPNGAAQPPAPQPGAVPQAPFHIPIGQQPIQNLNQGYLDHLRRILGIAGQPPLVPGQFPNQFGQAPFPPHNHAPAAPPPGYYYNPPWVPHAHAGQLPQQPLHQAPLVRGFYGPGGVWHPWPLDQAQDRNMNPPPAPTPSAAQPQPHSQPPPAPGSVPVSLPLSVPIPPAPESGPSTIALPDNGTTVKRTAPDADLSDSETETESESGDEGAPKTSNQGADSLAPRNAAALAALKRMGALGSSGSASGVSSGVEIRPALPSRSPSAVESSVAIATTEPAPAALASDVSLTPTPTVPLSSSTAADLASSSTSNTVPIASSSTTNGNISTAPSSTTSASCAPALLPLPDLTRPVGAQGYSVHYHNGPGMSSVPPSWRPGGSSRLPHPSGYPFTVPRNTPYPYGLPPPQYPSYPPPRPTASSSSGIPASRHFRPNLSTLPSTLTEEQLARLDRVTRDAIDERLKVLEGVSEAVHRCVEELTRVRSVLPPGTVGSALSGEPMPTPAAPAPATNGNGSGAASTSISAAGLTATARLSPWTVPPPPVAGVDPPAPRSSTTPGANDALRLPIDDLIEQLSTRIGLDPGVVTDALAGETPALAAPASEHAVAGSSRREEKKKASEEGEASGSV